MLVNKVRFQGATSIGRRNTCVKSFCRRFKLQRLSWSLVELTSYFVQFRLRVYRQVRSLGEVLSQQPISVFIGSTLPRTLRIAEVDINVARQGKLFVGREFLAPAISQVSSCQKRNKARKQQKSFAWRGIKWCILRAKSRQGNQPQECRASGCQIDSISGSTSGPQGKPVRD